MASRDADDSVLEASTANPGAGDDVEMTGEENGDQQVVETADDTELQAAADDDDSDDAASTQTTFLSYLASPIVSLLVGPYAQQTILYAHQALLVQSPFFKEACQDFIDDGSPRQIELPGEDLEAVGCFLEFLYTGEYFPRKIPGQRTLESDPSLPSVDDSGEQLLKHARTYTLAQKYGVDSLKSLATSKIHCVNSTAKGELVYARFVYANTSSDESVVRAPIASFWATRSHTLRAEAEEEFKSLCLEHPQFGYDVLTRVLDEKLRRERNEKMHPSSVSSSTRKRARHSGAGTQ